MYFQLMASLRIKAKKGKGLQECRRDAQLNSTELSEQLWMQVINISMSASI